jgi:hypothetical protein
VREGLKDRRQEANFAMVDLLLWIGNTLFTLDELWWTSHELLLIAWRSLREVLRVFELLLICPLRFILKLSEFLEMHEDLQRVGSVLGFLTRDLILLGAIRRKEVGVKFLILGKQVRSLVLRMSLRRVAHHSFTVLSSSEAVSFFHVFIGQKPPLLQTG